MIEIQNDMVKEAPVISKMSTTTLQIYFKGEVL